jgi:ATP synthase protein I
MEGMGFLAPRRAEGASRTAGVPAHLLAVGAHIWQKSVDFKKKPMIETSLFCQELQGSVSWSLHMDNETKKLIRTLGYLSTVGLSMALSIGIGALLGYYLDKKFHTSPWMFLVFLAFGIAAAFRNLHLMYKKAKDI